jgi:hypothetical protein
MIMVDEKQLKRWRLILGSPVQEKLSSYSETGLELDDDERTMDEALAAIYDDTSGGVSVGSSGSSQSRSAGLGPSYPRVAKWLGDIRAFFPEDVVSVIQSDAIERKGLRQLLFEPETLKSVKPDIGMVSTLMALKGRIPERAREAAREIVKAVVDEITRKLENDIRRAVSGALNRRKHSPIPSLQGIDWKRTISRNLKNYNREYNRIIPERFYFFDRARKFNNWTVILDMDQSGSMADSIIYGSVTGSIFASIPALNTRVVAFDTEVVDLTEQCQNDPVEMIFGVQLGGGTDINKSVTYCEQYITEPAKTLFILISDLYEGGNQASLVKRLADMHDSNVRVVCLLSLSDRGTPIYDESLARRLVSCGIPCFACTPGLLPEFLEGVLKGYDLNEMAKRVTKEKK